MITTDPKRLSAYGDRLDRIVKGALDSERAADPDAARLAAIEAKLAARLAAPPPAPPSRSRPVTYAGLAMIAGLAIYAVTRSPTPKPVPASAPVVVVTTATATAPSSPEPVVLPAISPSDLPSVRAPAVPSARTVVTAPSETDEIALIARAQASLASDPAASLALCRQHAHEFVKGHFAQEREAVAIEALVDLHRTREARDGLDAFVARYPTSSHRAHLEALVANAP